MNPIEGVSRLGEKILEEGDGIKIADVCKKLLENFLDDKLMKNSKIKVGKYAEIIGQNLQVIRPFYIASQFDELVKVSF